MMHHAQYMDGVSVIVPMGRAVQNMWSFINILEGRGHEGELVIVADGKCVDDVFESDEFSIEVVHVEHDGFRPSFLRNVGAGAAKHKQLVFLDDDCRPEPGYFDHIRAGRGFNGRGFIGAGRIDYYTRNGTELLEEDPRHMARSHAWTGNMTVMQKDFWQLGGFDPHFDAPGEIGEAAEFSERANQSGLDVQYLDGCGVKHLGELDGDAQLREDNQRKYFKERISELT